MTQLEQIEKVLDEQVRTQLALHGGNITSGRVENGVYYFRFTGQCCGCPSAWLTTENLIREEVTNAVPEIQDVVLEQSVSDELLEAAKNLLRKRDEETA